MRRVTISVLFLLVALTWGTTWLAMRIAAETIPPVFATGMRFMFAAPFLISIAWFRKTPLLFPPGQRLFQIIICVFYFSIPFSLMIYGETYVSSGLASIIFSNMPVAVLITSVLFLNEKTNRMQVTGLTIAIAALMGILLEETKTITESHWQGILALVSAVIIHAIIYTQCKKRDCSVSVITFNALPCFFAGLLLSAAGWLFERPQISTFSTNSILATIYLGSFAGVFGILCYFALQQKANAFQASLVFLIFPLIAVSLENYIYGYAISTHSMLLIIPLAIGIFLTLVFRELPGTDRLRGKLSITSNPMNNDVKTS
ncbi:MULTISPECIES: DMT family transporter [Enterobacterales]|uniref:DMT family transporter n=4 Tax=Enterobacteriaceae TaxID=543 RepID=A0AAE7GXR6_CITFR|nr:MULTISPECIES: DMT family transporter [Enterobacteriaceae]STF85320.1 putative DMT superfamily transporter inner membrane protein [Escherichia coli]ELM2200723.1 DMT family transporter [Citrobacter freundii]MBA7857750.1 DMT family transporter [Enterobacter sp. RHBSTW-00901]MBA7877967.1 DMT family transporter [Citrobacter sp. RHBSTW-00827]MBA7940525.1 DMT family transporter [Citrobacter sp. RHBSTW-00509]